MQQQKPPADQKKIERVVEVSVEFLLEIRIITITLITRTMGDFECLRRGALQERQTPLSFN